MDKIILRNALPAIFSNEEKTNSDIWQKDIQFEKGNYYLVEANSGTGKSSLCSYIYGYRADYLGDILFDDRNIREIKMNEWDSIRQVKLSILFQELNLFPELTAWENVVLKNNLTHYKTEEEIRQMFSMLGISDKKESLIGKMSWGQQQRVAIIRSLCQPFDFLILDEPISHLDDTNARIIAELIFSEASQQGAAVISTSIGKHLPLSYSKVLAL
ncbi:MAG: ATP-binding cassette domain-containing protein [Dysgonomonas sp.]|nr:ATP-binding cassette domain-containing protein [Dysgonomonas sp.]